MNQSKHQQINRHLSILQGVEFASEYLLNLRGQPTERQLCGLLAIFELVKLKLRIDKWRAQKSTNIFISENNPVEKVELEEEDKAEKFAQKWTEADDLKDSDIKTQLQGALNSLKKEKPKFNLGFQEVLDKSKLKMGVITTLPIPEQFKRPSNTKNNKSLHILMGEIVYLTRPIIHCIFLYIYGSDSYKPYLISLMLDLIRLFLEKNVEYYRKCEKAEMKMRLHDLIICYALRNPFYQRIMKRKILQPILGLLFKKDSKIAKFIIQLIEIRTSVSLLL